MSKRRSQPNILLGASGRKGQERAETVWIEHPITREKHILFDKGKHFPFKGFKIKGTIKFPGIELPGQIDIKP